MHPAAFRMLALEDRRTSRGRAAVGTEVEIWEAKT
jgi:hypothetical protein